jgi:hypothetical protein
MYVPFSVLCVLFVRKCVLYCYHRVSTKCVLYCCHRVSTKCVLYCCHRVSTKCVLYCCHRVSTKCVLYYYHRVSIQLQLKIQQKPKKYNLLSAGTQILQLKCSFCHPLSYTFVSAALSGVTTPPHYTQLFFWLTNILTWITGIGCKENRFSW